MLRRRVRLRSGLERQRKVLLSERVAVPPTNLVTSRIRKKGGGSTKEKEGGFVRAEGLYNTKSHLKKKPLSS